MQNFSTLSHKIAFIDKMAALKSPPKSFFTLSNFERKNDLLLDNFWEYLRISFFWDLIQNTKIGSSFPCFILFPYADLCQGKEASAGQECYHRCNPSGNKFNSVCLMLLWKMIFGFLTFN